MIRCSLSDLARPIKGLLTAFLLTIGIGYLTALFYLFNVDVDPHRRMGMGLVEGIEMKYHGDPTASRLEGALIASMAERVSSADREVIVSWARAGAPRDRYPPVQAILNQNCVACHSGNSPSIPSLVTYEATARLAQADRGPTLGALARVSHVHLFGLSIIFLLTGTVYAMSGVRQSIGSLVLVIPFIAIWLDIASWWLTKFAPAFAYVVLTGGALMGAALAVQVLGSLWAIWFEEGGHE